MTDDTASTNPVSPQGSILWAEDDALVRAMGRVEHSGHVRGMGVGPLPVRPISRSSASRLTQEAAFNTQMNEMMKKWEEEKRISDEQREEERRRADEERKRPEKERRTADEDRRRADEERKQTNERIAKQDQMMEKMQKMFDNLARANASLLANASSASLMSAKYCIFGPLNLHLLNR
jgi:chromosome segregation ATPase